jgi:hypothetical protein
MDVWRAALGDAHAVALVGHRVQSGVRPARAGVFSAVQVGLPPGEREAHAAFNGPSILIVTEGSGTLTAPGEDDDTDYEVPGSVVSVGATYLYIGVTFSSGRVDRLALVAHWTRIRRPYV